ncbi:hypothetical protein H2201_006025 [Coniosporium apollinis]|uniref:AB hydrolase-1 domain-containing protein n=1 Tax=Coniosporium apollinis TaxID=61459 RepID=A0ABQ9NRB9_9PEZI|nr:hypothetical protein H2201_006025 [Coniosporium apollinis]
MLQFLRRSAASASARCTIRGTPLVTVHSLCYIRTPIRINPYSEQITIRNASTTCSSPTSLPSQDSQTLTLSNGHTLGFSTCGSPSSQPIFYLHGFPSSRIEGLALSNLAQKLGARIITPDRPGIGLSTFDPHRELVDYPDSISQLAKHLRLDTYRVLGASGGGPYALACAKALPKDQLKRVGVLAGIGPPEAGLAGVRLGTRILLLSMSWAPQAMRRMVDWSFVRAAQHPDPQVLRQTVLSQLKWGNESERKHLLSDPVNFELLLRILREHFRQGAQGFIKDGQIGTKPWGFSLEDVESDVVLWYGTDDVNTPALMGRYMASRLKKAELKEYVGETHWTIFDNHGEEVLRDMLKD